MFIIGIRWKLTLGQPFPFWCLMHMTPAFIAVIFRLYNPPQQSTYTINFSCGAILFSLFQQRTKREKDQRQSKQGSAQNWQLDQLGEKKSSFNKERTVASGKRRCHNNLNIQSTSNKSNQINCNATREPGDMTSSHLLFISSFFSELCLSLLFSSHFFISNFDANKPAFSHLNKAWVHSYRLKPNLTKDP